MKRKGTCKTCEWYSEIWKACFERDCKRRPNRKDYYKKKRKEKRT
jgi:hypothetical protein